MTDSERIAFECGSCGKLLVAPSWWTGRKMKCPSCGTDLVIPDGSDEMTRQTVSNGPSVHDSHRQVAGSATTPERRPGGAHALSRPYSSPDDEFELPRDHRMYGPTATNPPPMPARTVRRSFARRHRTALIISGLAMLAAVWAVGGLIYYRDHVRAEGIMKSRGFGRALTREEVPDRHIRETMNEIGIQEATVAENPDDLQAAMELLILYKSAAADLSVFPRRWAGQVMNNAAWLLLTTRHAGLKDPKKALEWAKHATDLSRRRWPFVLDTLAEAYLQNGRPDDALSAAIEAYRINPDDASMKSRLEYFTAAAASGATATEHFTVE